MAEAEIIHVHNETPHGVFNRYRREGMARERGLWKNVSSILWFRLVQFHGTRMGYRQSGLLTPQLRETFYYARERKLNENEQRDVQPIRYNE